MKPGGSSGAAAVHAVAQWARNVGASGSLSGLVDVKVGGWMSRFSVSARSSPATWGQPCHGRTRPVHAGKPYGIAHPMAPL